ncbi:DUF7504 family protein [Halomicrococcus sp. SG-WS-1]|uniref:DUF7504 family protein n=1 Tax=Halomicrococcus sp. SG-WS-1 TaxID=3439057 RepID=UPI003F79D77D
MGDDPSVEAEFTRTLQRLKRRGCNLLLVGTVPDSVLTAASRKLLGDASERRYRLLVLAGAARSSGGRLPTADAVDTVRFVTYGAEPRGVDPEIPGCHVDDGLAELGSAISEAVTSFDTESGGLEPGELRVCLDSLSALMDRYDRRVVRQFLGIVTGQVRGANGMGHFVLPYERDHETVEAFASLFDAVIEYRAADGGQERWHFTGRDLTSPWLPV